jgi:glycosyltransferase involved in cell wall biosynthesis
MAESVTDNSLRVLFAVLEFSDRMLGGSRSLSLIVNHLRRIKPHVICFRDGEFYTKIKFAGIPATLLSDVREDHFDSIRKRSFTELFELVRQLAVTNFRCYRFVRRGSFKVVHCNSIYDFFHCFLGVKFARGRILFNIRGAHPNNKMKWHWHIPLMLSDAVIVLSDDMRQYYLERTWRPVRSRTAKKTQTIYSAIPFDEIDHWARNGRNGSRSLLELPQQRLIVACIGVFVARKAQLELIRQVIGPVTKEIPEVLFCFIGDADPGQPNSIAYLKACKNAVEELKLEDNVRFVGHHEAIYPWIVASDLTALCSQFEGLPRVMIETIACGRPVVATEVTSAHEILTRYNCGYVVTQGNWDEFGQRVVELLRECSLRTEMGLRGHAVARMLFDLATIVEQYESNYLRLAGNLR